MFSISGQYPPRNWELLVRELTDYSLIWASSEFLVSGPQMDMSQTVERQDIGLFILSSSYQRHHHFV